MFVQYGGYALPSNSVIVTISRVALKTEGGIYYAYDERWDLSTPLPGIYDTTQAGLTVDLNALTNAFSVDGYDLVLYDNNGAPTHHALYSAQCNGGTRVLNPPQFPDGTGAQYSTYRTFSCSIAGEVPLITGNVVTKFHETIEQEGTGGPVTVFIPVAQGTWVKQQTSATSTFKIVQSGSLETLYFPGSAPGPLFPDAEHQQLRRISRANGTMRNGRFYNFPLSWSYTFEGAGSLDGQPNSYPQ